MASAVDRPSHDVAIERTAESRGLGTMPTQQILIFGAGGHAKVVAEVARACGLEVIGFLEDHSLRDGIPYFGSQVVDWNRYEQDRERWRLIPIALAVGDNSGRGEVYQRLISAGSQIRSLVHSSAVISPTAVIGSGTVVMAAAVVNADAHIGMGVIVNTSAVVEHDCRVGDFAHLSPNVALGGGARVGPRAHLGIGAVVLPRVEIGADSIVGAGSVVLDAVEPGTTVVGAPARVIHPSRRD
jgi:sugar O-acyltransferase (sialic acid O-acetyltransferase NeuD family)